MRCGNGMAGVNSAAIGFVIPIILKPAVETMKPQMDTDKH